MQVNLEIACGAVNTARLEQALRDAGFSPEKDRIWQWITDAGSGAPVVKFELLADLHDQQAETTISFDKCENLGAVNLRGTGFASRDIEVRELSAQDGEDALTAEVNVSGLAGFLLAKTAGPIRGAKRRTGTTLRSYSCTTMPAGRQLRSNWWSSVSLERLLHSKPPSMT